MPPSARVLSLLFVRDSELWECPEVAGTPLCRARLDSRFKIGVKPPTTERCRATALPELALASRIQIVKPNLPSVDPNPVYPAIREDPDLKLLNSCFTLNLEFFLIPSKGFDVRFLSKL